MARQSYEYIAKDIKTLIPFYISLLVKNLNTHYLDSSSTIIKLIYR